MEGLVVHEVDILPLLLLWYTPIITPNLFYYISLLDRLTDRVATTRCQYEKENF